MSKICAQLNNLKYNSPKSEKTFFLQSVVYGNIIGVTITEQQLHLDFSHNNLFFIQQTVDWVVMKCVSLGGDKSPSLTTIK